MTKYIGLIGHPLKHSISPDFQQAALAYYSLNIRYEAWETSEDKLSSTINRLRQPQNLGANVTVPYKEKVMSLLDEVDRKANLIGAVNVVVNKDGKLVGFNTDAYGFIQGLRKDAVFEPQDKHVVLLGAGGVARAASFALIQANVASLTIINRTLERAEILTKFLIKNAGCEKSPIKIVPLSWNKSELRDVIRSSQLIVNCTTMGMKHSPQAEQTPLESDIIPSSVLVYDLVYNPLETPLLKAAIKAGARTLGGLPMLIYQGADAFKLCVGIEAPIDVMLSTAKAALERYR